MAAPKRLIARESLARRWLYAVKPASWPKLLVPALLGQALGVAATGRLSPAAALAGLGFTVLDLVFIVLLNDWGDRKVDGIKRRMFPDGCSPKTIPDGVLGARAVGAAGAIAGAAALALAFGVATPLERPALGWAAAACLAIFVAYTLPPIALNYRGGGEALEALGVGVALPAVNLYIQGGTLPEASLVPLIGFGALSLASAVASGLSDEESDRAGGKSTVVTRFGNARARAAVEGLVLGGAALWITGAAVVGDPGAWIAALAATATSLWHWRRLRAASAAAVTNAFRAHAAYKMHLHRAIWYGGLVLGAAHAAAGLIR